MTKRLKLGIVALVLMLCGGLAQAQSFMTIYPIGGAPQGSYSLLDVKKVTFNDGKMLIWQDAGSDSFDLNGVLSVKFTDEQQTAIDRVSLGTSQIRFVTDGDALSITGADRAPVAIYAVNGQQVYHNLLWRGEAIGIRHLQPGIYIIQINNTTFKFKK